MHPRGGLREATIDGELAKILIIEDDDVIAQGMARHLQSAGYDAVGSRTARPVSRACATSAPTSACWT